MNLNAGSLVKDRYHGDCFDLQMYNKNVLNCVMYARIFHGLEMYLFSVLAPNECFLWSFFVFRTRDEGTRSRETIVIPTKRVKGSVGEDESGKKAKATQHVGGQSVSEKSQDT